MKEILDAGGAAYLMPVVLFAIVLYLCRSLFGWHGRRSQNRKEFLELWDPVRSQDDLWLEAAVRHWLGTYLPAHVIRLAMEQPDKSQSLIDLSELWPLFRYDRNARTVEWLHRRHCTLGKRKANRILLIAGYFAAAMSAIFAALIASHYGHESSFGWITGIFTLILGCLAFICLIKDEAVKNAVVVGDEWVERINRSASPSGTRSRGDDRDKGAVPH